MKLTSVRTEISDWWNWHHYVPVDQCQNDLLQIAATWTVLVFAILIRGKQNFAGEIIEWINIYLSYSLYFSPSVSRFSTKFATIFEENSHFGDNCAFAYCWKLKIARIILTDCNTRSAHALVNFKFSGKSDCTIKRSYTEKSSENL